MRKRFAVTAWAVLAALGLAGGVAAEPSGKDGLKTPMFEFGLIGDFPYDAEQYPKWITLIEKMNQEQLAFVVHDGDFKGGAVRCDDALYHARLAEFQSFVHPFVFIPGDNDWTDCHRPAAGGYDPLERLDFLRRVFYPDEFSLGRRTIRLTRQSETPGYETFVENVRWVYGQVVFVGLNVQGSNNNLGRTPEQDQEYVGRNAANLYWIAEGFRTAREVGSAAVMLIFQANPEFEVWPARPAGSGFTDTIAAIERETLGFGKPVVVVHGDSHYFRIDKPLRASTTGRRIERFTRVETFGSPDVHWLRAKVDPRDANVFTFVQEIVPENLVDHAP